MKYLPIIWSGLWRKRVEAVLTWLAVTAAFTLFGLMAGLHATYQNLLSASRMDRLDVNARFPDSSPSGILLPIAVRSQIAGIPGVSAVGSYYWLWGYYQNLRNIVQVIAVDDNMRAAWSELPLSEAQWQQLFATPTGLFVSVTSANKFGLKKGDTFPVLTQPSIKADGNPLWDFTVLGVVPDDPRIGDFILGNYSYVDKERPLQNQGLVMGFRVAVRSATQADATSLAIDGRLANSSTPTITIPDKANMLYAVNSGLSMAKSTWPIAGAGFFMILLLTANGIAQSVNERATEFAVLEAFGFRVEGLMALVFAESLIPCLVGAVLGTVLADIMTQVPARYLVLDFSGIPKPTLTPQVLGWSVMCALVLAIASATVPMLRLRHLSVADALSGR